MKNIWMHLMNFWKRGLLFVEFAHVFLVLLVRRPRKVFFLQECDVAIDFLIAVRAVSGPFVAFVNEGDEAKIQALRYIFRDSRIYRVNEPLVVYDRYNRWILTHTKITKILELVNRILKVEIAFLTMIAPDPDEEIVPFAGRSSLRISLMYPSQEGFPKIVEKVATPGKIGPDIERDVIFPTWQEIAKRDDMRAIVQRVQKYDWLARRSGYAKALAFWDKHIERYASAGYVLLVSCENYQVLDFFDSVLTDDRPKILLCDYANHSGDLYASIRPNDAILKLERFNPEPPPPEDPDQQVSWLSEAASVRLFTELFWGDVPLPDEVEVFSFVGFLRNISVARYMKAQGVPVNMNLISFDDGRTERWPLGVSADAVLAARGNASGFEQKLASCCGLDELIALTPGDQNLTAYTVAYPSRRKMFPKKIWAELEARFPIAPDCDPGAAILFIDQPLWNYPGLDFERTQRNVETLLIALREAGATIHAKPHPSWPNRTVLDGTSFSFDAMPFPKWMPGEYVVNRYRAVLFFFSMMAKEADPEGRFTMLNLMKFESEEAYRRRITFCLETLQKVGPVKGEIDIDRLDAWVEAVVSRTR